MSACSTTAGSAAVEANNEGLRDILNVALPTVGGAQRRLKDFRGQIVMLHFFSSWCGQCKLEAPTLRNVHNSFKDSKFTVVGVAVEDDPFQAQAFVSNFQLPFPVLLDISGELKQYFSVKELPATLFLDRNGVPIRFQDPSTGNVTAMIEGARMWDTTKPVEMIANLVEHL
jgi:peroxiredoxin